MKRFETMLKRLTDPELFAFSEAVDAEMDIRSSRLQLRGYRRSTYLADMARGRRRAPRPHPAERRRLAA